MAEKYTDAFIDSAKQYIHNLRYLAKRDPVTLRDISLLEMLLQVYNWAEWFEVAENDKIKIQKLLDCIYLRNPHLVLPHVIPGVYYSNVSTPQTIWTWQRVWDNLEGVTSGGPGGDTLYLTVAPTLRVVPSAAGTTALTVSSNTAWTATSNQPWCTVTGSGTGNATIIVTHALNILTTSRTATITLSATGVPSVTATINQAGTVALLSVTPSSRSVVSTAATTTFAVTTNTTWTAASAETWCTVTPSGSGNGTLIATFTENLTGGSRTANITVSAPGAAPVTVQVTQAWTATNISVTPSTRSVTKTAATTTFAVTSNTSWVVTSNVAWCTVTPSGSNNGTITATYTENTSVGSRTALITITAPGLAPIVVSVVQSGVTPSLTVTPPTQEVASPAGLITYLVTTNAAWTAVSNVSWCTVTPSGAGESSLTATYTENTLNVSRIATITVSVVGASPVQVTLTQLSPVVTGIIEFRQGYIYNWYTITDSRKLTSSDDWRVATTGPIETEESTADLIVLRASVMPNYTNLLLSGTNSTGFNGPAQTLGRNTNGVFHTPGEYPTGTILLSPLVTEPIISTPTATIITLLSFTPNSSYGVGFPTRLVKTSTLLTNGQTGTYIGNNGIEYPTMCIAGKEWVVANLIETNYRNGDSIPEKTADIDWIQSLNDYQGARCSHNNDESTAFVYVLP